MAWFDRLFAAALPLVPRAMVRKLSSRYIAGEERDAALERGRALQGGGYRVTYDLLGEAVRDRAEVAAAATEYRELLEALQRQELELNISLKPTQMGLDLDENLCFQTVSEIATQAAGMGAFVRFEMEDSPTIDGTLRVFDRLRAVHGATVGCVLQSMLHRTPEDVRQLLESEAPLNVRLVKGIYVEPEEIAWQDPAKVTEEYLRLLRVLLDGGAFVAVASHDETILDGLKALLADDPARAARCEVQMLLGVREELRTQVREAGIPVRVYVPYGKSWYPYVTRRLRGNPKLARYAFLGLFGRRENLD